MLSGVLRAGSGRVWFAVIGWLLSIGSSEAAVELPSYAQGADIKQSLNSKGREVTELVMFAGGVVAIICILVGSLYLKAGNREKAKSFIWGGVGGLLLDTMVYAIAQLVVK